MSFIASISNHFSFPVIFLSDTEHNTSVEIFAKGAMLNAFIVTTANGKQQNIIDGYISEQDYKENSNWFKSAKLSPFVCRLYKGMYVHNEITYKTGKYFIGEEALHGLLYNLVFEIKDYGSNDEYAYARLSYDYNNIAEGFPFQYLCTVNYKFYAGSLLLIETIIKNLSAVSMPVNDGWHPYFTLGGNLNEYELSIHSNAALEYNEQLLPTGKLIADNPFERPAILGKTVLDNSFLLKDFSRAACTLKNKENNLCLEIFADESYPYFQVFTPDHRKSIALENLSSALDSFNNKMNLVILQAGEEKKFSVKYKVSV